ncbi:MAG: T9SS type A sorting domain-containing protein [Chitinophagaceae bacterium]|nr:T9SS type A sorting domain-containing protein [Chitinophagaceae bacterium]
MRSFLIFNFLIVFNSLVYGQPDLMLNQPMVLSPMNLHIGETDTIFFQVQNFGTLGASSSHIGIYISPTTFRSDAQLMGEISLEGLPAGSVSDVIKYVHPIPYTFSPGVAYIFIELNVLDEIPGEDLSNNENISSPITLNLAWAEQNIPYPIIFIHGLNGSDETWINMIDSLNYFYGLSYGGRLDFCLNQDGDNFTSNLTSDYRDWTDTNNLLPGDFFTINFDVDIFGTAHDIDYKSNQAGIVKQGLAVRDAIKHVLAITGREKVLLVCHSMGGLAAREYLQNGNLFQQNDGLKHVAKLVTIGTPHGGSNATDFGIVIDENSEAVRDLRTGYAYSYYWPLGAPNPNRDAPGTYLFGGVEDLNYMVDSYFSLFFNADVNCDGVVSGQPFIGLNNRSIPVDLSYACVVGTGDLLGGDGVVLENNANLNNYISVNAKVYTWPKTSGVLWHSELTKQFSKIIQAIDEPFDFNSGHTFKISTDQLYYGTITDQSTSGSRDYDGYQINITSSGTFSLQVYDIPVSIFTVSIYNSSGTNILNVNSNKKSSLNLNAVLTAGTFYIVISGITESRTVYSPYAFNCTFRAIQTYCQGTTYLSTSSGTFTDGSGTSNYSSNSDCKWLIQPSGATNIHINFSFFDVSNPNDTVYIYDGNSVISPLLAKWTGNTLPGSVSSTSGCLLVRFSTDGSITAGGWTANYSSTIVNTFCSSSNVLTSPNGSFSDGSDTSDYANFTHCTWLIRPAGAFNINLNFTTFNTESGIDFVNVYDGGDDSAPLLGSFSGASLPPVISSSGGQMFIEFISNNLITLAGWHAFYTSNIPNVSNGIVEYEYWFDTVITSIVNISLVPQAILNLNTNINTRSLSTGLHTLHLRFKDQNEDWSSVLSKYIYVYSSMPVLNSSISKYEYWFDNDYSSATTSLISPNRNYVLNAALTATFLSHGLHSMHIRFGDMGGTWSSVLSEFIYKSGISGSGLYQMSNYRYWVDNDTSGITNRTFIIPLTNEELYDTLNLTSFSIGNHYIHFQFQDDLGQWSSVVTDSFYRDTISTSILLSTVQNSINLYPNPSNGKFILEFYDEIQEGKVVVFNSLGKEIYVDRISNRNGIFTKEIAINDIPGVYFIVVINKTKRLIHKLVVE